VISNRNREELQARFQAVIAYLKTEVFPRIQKMITLGESIAAAQVAPENDHEMVDSTPEEDEEVVVVQEVTPSSKTELATRKQRLSS
jgi:hypothetical protein